MGMGSTNKFCLEAETHVSLRRFRRRGCTELVVPGAANDQLEYFTPHWAMAKSIRSSKQNARNTLGISYQFWRSKSRKLLRKSEVQSQVRISEWKRSRESWPSDCTLEREIEWRKHVDQNSHLGVEGRMQGSQILHSEMSRRPWTFWFTSQGCWRTIEAAYIRALFIFEEEWVKNRYWVDK